MGIYNMTAAELYERANAAAADAIRFRRDPAGEAMASMRAQDAASLRAFARTVAQREAGAGRGRAGGVAG